MKARKFADWRKQWEYTKKEEGASPTACLSSIFITAAIEAHEGRDMAVIDLPGAFFACQHGR